MLTLPEPFIRAEIAYRRDRALTGVSSARRERHGLFLTLRPSRRRPSPAPSPGYGRLAATQHC